MLSWFLFLWMLPLEVYIVTLYDLGGDGHGSVTPLVSCPSVVTHTALPGCSSGKGLAWCRLPKIFLWPFLKSLLSSLYLVRFSELNVRLLFSWWIPILRCRPDIKLLEAIHTIKVMLTYRRLGPNMYLETVQQLLHYHPLCLPLSLWILRDICDVLEPIFGGKDCKLIWAELRTVVTHYIHSFSGIPSWAKRITMTSVVDFDWITSNKHVWENQLTK